VFVKLSKSYERLVCALFVGGTDINDTYTDLEQNGAQVDRISLYSLENLNSCPHRSLLVLQGAFWTFSIAIAF
jgi:hypothetical protein